MVAADARQLTIDEVWPHIAQLLDSIGILIETPYVDKVYRDSYYHYYSSKSGKYPKDCIRLSIFSEEIEPEVFRSPDANREVNSKYLGFIILRPTVSFVVGRSTMSTQALKDNDFLSCSVKIPTSANSVKLFVN
jgi:hypothetical protein